MAKGVRVFIVGLASVCFLLSLLLSSSTTAQATTSSSGPSCNYFYQTIPGNNSECYPPEGTKVTLYCNINAPHDSTNTSLAIGTVNWFKNSSSSETGVVELPGESPTLATDIINSSSSSIHGLYFDIYTLIIHNISVTDSGYYWCEIEANRTCFNRSPFVNIRVREGGSSSTNSPTTYCTPTQLMRAPICATTVCKPDTSTMTLSSTMTVETSPSTTPRSMTSPSPTPTPCSEDVCRIGVSASAGVVLLLFVCLCCMGLCICHRKRKGRVREKSRGVSKDENSWFAEGASNATTHLDDATGRIDQQGTGQAVDHTNTVTLTAYLPAAYETPTPCGDRQEASATNCNLSGSVKKSSKSISRRVPETGFKENQLADQLNKSIDKNITIETESSKITHNGISDQREMTVSSGQPKLSSPPKGHCHYEHVVSRSVTERSIVNDEWPMYDDPVLTTDSTPQFEQSQLIKAGESHKYHELCSPIEMKAFQIGASPIDETQSSPSKHNYETVLAKADQKQPSLKHDYETVLSKVETDDLQARHNEANGFVLIKERPTTRTAKKPTHNYEEIDDEDLHIPPRHVTRETMETEQAVDPSVGLPDREFYNKLSSSVVSEQLLSGVVKAVHTSENGFVDNYYSVAKVHELVPIGGKTEPYVTDHLYQELDEGKAWQGGQASFRNNQPFNRHHTFTSSTNSTNIYREPLLRTYSESVERLYDEPYLVTTNPVHTHRGKAASKVMDAQSFESLFDEPKYYSQDSSPFDDPKYDTPEAGVPPQSSVVDESRLFQATASDTVPKPPPLYPQTPATDDIPTHNLRDRVTR